jgi:hypothetical protein
MLLGGTLSREPVTSPTTSSVTPLWAGAAGATCDKPGVRRVDQAANGPLYVGPVSAQEYR